MNWTDANVLPWLIPVPPLIAFVVIILGVGRYKTLTHITAIFAISLSWLFSFAEVLAAFNTHDLGTKVGGIFGNSITWLSNGNSATSGTINMGVAVDPLTAIMLFMVPLACLLIFIYSLGYMNDDPRTTRFFAYLSLFASAMLVLVVADNLLMLFIGWEIMGLCSYLLIGFWYEKESAYKAAIKAFMTTRVADVIFLIGIAYLWASTGTLNFRAVLSSPEVLKTLGTTPAIGGILGLTAAGVIGICIVVGTIGKSAQFPLHVWLPDAMEGPTPVSAMIHAATMVSAGVYLVIRMYPVLSAGGNPELGVFTTPMVLMAVVGSFTALFAASIAITQNDIKRVLAYSTISQLGFMIAALGVGAYAAAAFHLITHAFFKALLFLGSGSVIHGMEHGEHTVHAAHTAHDHDEHGHEDHEHDEHAKPFDPQDMRNMGGLWRTMPVTAITFIIGGMSLAGLPLVTAGFWSKDEIFAEAWAAGSHNALGLMVFVVLAFAAFLTTVYTFRQIAMTFFGEPRTEAARYALHNDGTVKGRRINAQLVAPLIVLAFFAIFAGFVGVNPGFWILGPALAGWPNISAPFANWVNQGLLEPPSVLPFNIIPVIISFTAFGLGALVGWRAYLIPFHQNQLKVTDPDPVEKYIGSEFYGVLANKYYIDQFYTRYLVRPVNWLSTVFSPLIIDNGVIDRVVGWISTTAIFIGNTARAFNTVVIDGVGDGIPEALYGIARSLRVVQNGQIQRYLLYALAAAIVIGVNLAPAAVILDPYQARTVIALMIIIELVLAGAIVYIAANRAQATHGEGD